jgi:hypothetical protein
VYTRFKQNKEFFNAITQNNLSIFFINSLSLTKFSFQSEISKKSSNKFLQQIERELIDKYKYVAIYIQDLVHVSFVAFFLKKPTFLANFIAFQIEKLPKNRRETKMIRFIIKTIKIFAAQRKEIIGLKIQFKGRVNR